MLYQLMHNDMYISVALDLEAISFLIFFGLKLVNCFNIMANQRIENIVELPTEMLHRILSFVPNRFNVSLVCRRMYEVVCAVERNKFVLKTITNCSEETVSNNTFLSTLPV